MMYAYAQADDHGKIFSVFASSLPVDDPTDVFEVADYDSSLIGRYVTKNGEISAPPQPGTFYVWDENTSSFNEVRLNS